ncbi:unnamed protein product, partial [Meganyctiphanes norvegica]
MRIRNILKLLCTFPTNKMLNMFLISSVILPLPAEVLSYLQDDGTLVLPEDSQPETTYTRNCDNDDVEEESVDSWGSDANEPSLKGPKFEEFNEKVREAIKKLGGSVFPKLNWSSPKDASWIALNNSLRCYFPGDIFLILKSSIFVTHDLTCPFKDCDDDCNTEEPVLYYLILRKWIEINPSNEFRCFVQNKKLIGISQRDVSQNYSCISAQQNNIQSDIVSFWHENIENRFPLSDYVFDVYRPAKDKVILVDFNPFGPTTDQLLFTWEELKEKKEEEDDIYSCPRIIEEEEISGCNLISHSLNELQMNDSNRITMQTIQDEDNGPEFRYIDSTTGVQPGPYMQYGLPVDIVDLSTGQDPYKLVDFLQMKTQAENGGNESSSDEDEQQTPGSG